jgi:hypothetical protein
MGMIREYLIEFATALVGAVGVVSIWLLAMFAVVS